MVVKWSPIAKRNLQDIYYFYLPPKCYAVY